jgi:16S rRNA C1402 N4-methylase RsmH
MNQFEKQLKIVCNFLDEFRDILSEKDTQQVVYQVKNALPKRPHSTFLHPIKDTNKAIKIEFENGIAKKLSVLIESKDKIIEKGYKLPEE